MLSNTFYNAPNGTIHELFYVGMLVNGSKQLFLHTYQHEVGTVDDGQLYIASLKTGQDRFMNKSIDIANEFREVNCALAFDHLHNNLLLLSNTARRQKDKLLYSAVSYNSALISIDAATLYIKEIAPLNSRKIDEYRSKTINTTEHFGGIPTELCLNNDSSIIIVSEEISKTSDNRGGTYTILGNLGITELDNNENELAGYAVSKKQKTNTSFDPFYTAKMRKGEEVSLFNCHAGFIYIRGNKKNYMIVNDDLGNFNKAEREKRDGIDENNTVIYTLENGVMKKSLLFGQPTEEYNSYSCFISSADYDKRTGTMAVLLVERHGRHQWENKLAWIYFN